MQGMSSAARACPSVEAGGQNGDSDSSCWHSGNNRVNVPWLCDLDFILLAYYPLKWQQGRSFGPSSFPFFVFAIYFAWTILTPWVTQCNLTARADVLCSWLCSPWVAFLLIFCPSLLSLPPQLSFSLCWSLWFAYLQLSHSFCFCFYAASFP